MVTALKLHAALLAVAALLALTSCLTPPPLPADASTERASADEASANQPSANEAPANQAEPDAPEKHARPFQRSARELLASLKIGWNLGNALDAPESETAWGNPPVTPPLLQAVAQAGFSVVRIPVTWTLHTGGAPDFTIEPSWLDRVAEVVSYARAAGLVSIINVHHDGADGFKQVEWITLNDDTGAITAANDAAVRARFVKVWTQIAQRFAAYGEELLFESMNEIHDGYGQPNPKYFATINALNQTFIDVVRGTGGNNAQRHLVVPGYNTNIDHTLAGFQLPKDPTPQRLIVSAHYYDPYLFALQAQKHTWGKASPGNDGWGQEDFVLTQLDKLKKRFVDQGVPVILGEYGAVHQQGYEDYRRYYLEYVTKAAVDRGIVPIYWDNGGEGSGAEKSALFNRRTHQVLHPKLLEAMMRAAKHSYPLSEVTLPQAAAEATARK